LERIAVEKQWSKEDVESDLAILAKNRLVYVNIKPKRIEK
jgi:hypothetical protein